MLSMQKGPGYAESQIRVLLKDLTDTSNSTREKAAKKFKDYIDKVRPELYDDDVEYLFTGGTGGGKLPNGLLYYAGQSSSKHEGQLKRIAAPVIALIKFLISIDLNEDRLEGFRDEEEGNVYDNIFYDQFICLSIEELRKINFAKHILGYGDARGGNADDALELLSVVMRDHRDLDGEYEVVEAHELIGYDESCNDKLQAYLTRTNAEELTKTIAELREKQLDLKARSDTRPRTWADLEPLYKTVPAQEGESGLIADLSEELEEYRPVVDPLGLSGTDLRETQELQAAGHLGIGIETNRRGIAAGGIGIGGERNHSKIDSGHHRSSISHHASHGNSYGGPLGMDGMDQNDELGGLLLHADAAQNAAQYAASVLPEDKAFSPELFLTLVHSNVSFEQLQTGAANLRSQLQEQENHRESLVRTNFGLFVHCAEALEWLKAYRKGKVTAITDKTVKGPSKLDARSDKKSDQDGELKLKQAQTSLDSAKSEANSTLAPILSRMKRSRMIKSTEIVVKRLASTLEEPHKLNLCLQNGDMEQCVEIYKCVLAISTTTSMRMVQRVKESAHKVVLELKEQCLSALQRPEPSFPTLIRHGKIISQLCGHDSCRDYMRECFEKQLSSFNQLVSDLITRFAREAEEAETHAQALAAERKKERTKISRRSIALRRGSESGPGSNHSPGGIGGIGIASQMEKLPSKLKSAKKWRPTDYHQSSFTAYAGKDTNANGSVTEPTGLGSNKKTGATRRESLRPKAESSLEDLGRRAYVNTITVGLNIIIDLQSRVLFISVQYIYNLQCTHFNFLVFKIAPNIMPCYFNNVIPIYARTGTPQVWEDLQCETV